LREHTPRARLTPPAAVYLNLKPNFASTHTARLLNSTGRRVPEPSAQFCVNTHRALA